MHRIDYSGFLRTAISAILAVLLAMVCIACISETPGETMQLFFFGPFRSIRYFGNMLESAIPLMFAGLSMCVVFSAAQFNLAAEGIFFIAGMLASAVGVYYALPAGTHRLLVILTGGLVGALIMLIPAILKAKLKANELLVSLMMNNIFAGVGAYLLNTYFNDTSAAFKGMPAFLETAKLPIIIPGTRVHLGLVIVVLLAILLYLFLYRSKWGYEIRMVGANQEFAAYSGINITKVILMAYLISGLISGSGAAIENIGLHERFEWSALPGYGFSGALIAIMGRNNPLGVLLSSLFIAYLRTGAALTSRLADVPSELEGVLQGVIFLLISVQSFAHSRKRKRAAKEVQK